MDFRVDCNDCKLLIDGERGRNRTFNLLIKSQLLCQLSYAPIFDRTAFSLAKNLGNCEQMQAGLSA